MALVADVAAQPLAETLHLPEEPPGEEPRSGALWRPNFDCSSRHKRVRKLIELQLKDLETLAAGEPAWRYFACFVKLVVRRHEAKMPSLLRKMHSLPRRMPSPPEASRSQMSRSSRILVRQELRLPLPERAMERRVLSQISEDQRGIIAERVSLQG